MGETDTISRQAVLSYIDRILHQGTGKQKSFEFIRKYVEKLPSVQPEQRWIPCSERLPNAEDCPMDCLVTRKSKYIGNYTDMAVCEKTECGRMKIGMQ